MSTHVRSSINKFHNNIFIPNIINAFCIRSICNGPRSTCFRFRSLFIACRTRTTLDLFFFFLDNFWIQGYPLRLNNFHHIMLLFYGHTSHRAPVIIKCYHFKRNNLRYTFKGDNFNFQSLLSFSQRTYVWVLESIPHKLSEGHLYFEKESRKIKQLSPLRKPVNKEACNCPKYWDINWINSFPKRPLNLGYNQNRSIIWIYIVYWNVCPILQRYILPNNKHIIKSIVVRCLT